MNDNDISRAQDRPDWTVGPVRSLASAPVAATMNEDDILRARDRPDQTVGLVRSLATAHVAATLLLLLPLYLLLAPTRECCIASIPPCNNAVLYGMLCHPLSVLFPFLLQRAHIILYVLTPPLLCSLSLLATAPVAATMNDNDISLAQERPDRTVGPVWSLATAPVSATMNDDDILRARDRPDRTSTAPVAATMNDDDILRAWDRPDRTVGISRARDRSDRTGGYIHTMSYGPANATASALDISWHWTLADRTGI